MKVTVASALRTIEFSSRPSHVLTNGRKQTVHAFYGVVEGKTVRGDSYLSKTAAREEARKQITTILEG